MEYAGRMIAPVMFRAVAASCCRSPRGPDKRVVAARGNGAAGHSEAMESVLAESKLSG